MSAQGPAAAAAPAPASAPPTNVVIAPSTGTTTFSSTTTTPSLPFLERASNFLPKSFSVAYPRSILLFFVFLAAFICIGVYAGNGSDNVDLATFWANNLAAFYTASIGIGAITVPAILSHNEKVKTLRKELVAARNLDRQELIELGSKLEDEIRFIEIYVEEVCLERFAWNNEQTLYHTNYIEAFAYHRAIRLLLSYEFQRVLRSLSRTPTYPQKGKDEDDEQYVNDLKNGCIDGKTLKEVEEAFPYLIKSINTFKEMTEDSAQALWTTTAHTTTWRRTMKEWNMLGTVIFDEEKILRRVNLWLRSKRLKNCKTVKDAIATKTWHCYAVNTPQYYINARGIMDYIGLSELPLDADAYAELDKLFNIKKSAPSALP